MGRNLANNILTQFKVYKRNNGYRDYDFNKNKKKVLDQISKTVDLSLYDLVKEEKDYCEYKLKLDYANKYIKELLMEIDELTKINTIDDFDVNNFEAKFIEEDNNIFLKINDETMSEDEHYETFYWMINDHETYCNIDIRGKIIYLWFDIPKYCGEDETGMLRVINNMKMKYYHSKLSGALIYVVVG